MKLPVALLGFALGLATTAAAQAAEPPLPVTHIVYKLAQDGIAVRSLEAEDGAYEARVEATDGTIVKVGIDPQTAELTDAYSHARARRAHGPAPKVSAAEAIQAVAATGHWDVRAIEFERGAWEVKAGDDQGRMDKFRVDGTTGSVR
ncbi:MAG: PepSY domain-containing protein [Magnetospirillum sp.]|nr:PepSY domain-containing protein [Magnetospirillum sp.]